MREAIGYIFSHLETTEKTFRNQAKINRNLLAFTFAVAVYAIAQSKRIGILEREVKELKQKGD